MTDLSELDEAGEFLALAAPARRRGRRLRLARGQPQDAEYRDYVPVCVVRLTKGQVDALVVEHLRPLPTAGGY